MLELNREIPMFGREHSKLQASVMAVRFGEEIQTLQTKDGSEAKDDDYGYMNIPVSEYSRWEPSSKTDGRLIEIETTTPEQGEDFLKELGVNIEELKQADNLLI